MLVNNFFLFVFFLLNFLLPNVIQACLHFDQQYKDLISEQSRNFLYYLNSQNNLEFVISSSISSKDNLPDRIAMVLPVPSIPLGYEELKGDIFRELNDYFKLFNAPSKGLRQGISSNSKSTSSHFQLLEVHKSNLVGNYKITPLEIKTLNNKTITVLDEWLKSNNFIPMPQEHQKKFLNKGTVFLAIEANFINMKTAQLRPLKITLSTKSLIDKKFVIPISFTHKNRHYQANIYTFNLALSIREEDRKDFKNYLVYVDYMHEKVIEGKFTTIQSLIGKSDGKLLRWSIPFSGANSNFSDPEIMF